MQLYKVRTFGEVISDFFTFIKENFRPLMSYILKFFLLPMIGLSILLTLTGMPSMSFDPTLVTRDYTLIAVVLSALIVFLVSMIYVYGRVYGYMKGYADHDGDQELAATYSANHGGAIAIRIGILIILVMVLAGGFFVLMTQIIGSNIEDFAEDIGIGTFFLLTFVLLIGILIVSVRWSFAVYIYSVREADLLDAFRQSWAVTSGHWWYTFGAIMLIGLIFNLLSKIITLPFTLMLTLPVITAGSYPLFEDATVKVMASVVSNTIQMSIAIFAVPAAMIVYYSLYEKMYGRSLEREINEIGRQTDEGLFENKGEY